MYSDELLRLFKKNDMLVGDKIRLVSKELRLEGELMPNTEAGDPSTVVVKLENGYNVGIAYDASVSIEKISSRSGIIEFPRSDVTTREGLPKVTLLYTGGTIGSKIDYKTGGTHPLIEPAELLYEIPELSEIANLSIKQLFSIWSEDMSYLEWQAIANEVQKELNRGVHGVVITMGTDTMHYAAAALSFMLQDLNAPVVITGAQRSSDRGSSDAFFNLSAAMQIAARSDIAEVGICMHATSSDDRCVFIRGTRARKLHTSKRDAFRSVNDKPIAYVDSKLNITYNSDYSKVVEELEEELNIQSAFEPKVALIKVHPNSDPEVIDFYLRKGYKGLILEGTGFGNVAGSEEHPNLSWLGNIDRAVKKGMVIGMTSQAIYGRVNKNVYSRARTISNLGVVYCHDMLPETAYVKLGWLLGNYSPEEAKKLLDKNMVGEIKNRSGTDEFIA